MAKKQFELAEKVYSCYEAGLWGYNLHRHGEVINYVVRPKDWDEYGRRSRPTSGMPSNCVNLDRYVAATSRLLRSARASEAEDNPAVGPAARAVAEGEQRLAAQGRSDALYYGHRLEGEWWVEAPGKSWYAPIVMALLEPCAV